MKHTLALVLMVFGLVGGSEVSSSEDIVINLSCSLSEILWIDGTTFETFKRQKSSSKSWRFPMAINKSKGTIKTNFMGDFKKLNEGELEYSASAYKILDSVTSATNRLTIDRMSLQWRLHTFDSNSFNNAPANGEPEKQSSFANGQCYKADKI